MQNFHLFEYSAEAFQCQSSSSRTGCNQVHFPVHSGWNSRDVSMNGMWFLAPSFPNKYDTCAGVVVCSKT